MAFKFNATVGTGVGNPPFVYAYSYKNAADILLAKTYESGSKAELDQAVFPIIFLYRHSIELLLKAIYLTYSNDDDETKIKTIDNCLHNIGKIYNKVEILIQELSKNLGYDDTSILDAISRDVKYVASIDRFSFNFRYPFDKKLNKFHKLPEDIDVNKFKKATDELHCNLNATVGAFDHLIELESYKSAAL